MAVEDLGGAMQPTVEMNPTVAEAQGGYRLRTKLAAAGLVASALFTPIVVGESAAWASETSAGATTDPSDPYGAQLSSNASLPVNPTNTGGKGRTYPSTSTSTHEHPTPTPTPTTDCPPTPTPTPTPTETLTPTPTPTTSKSTTPAPSTSTSTTAETSHPATSASTSKPVPATSTEVVYGPPKTGQSSNPEAYWPAEGAFVLAALVGGGYAIRRRNDGKHTGRMTAAIAGAGPSPLPRANGRHVTPRPAAQPEAPIVITY